MSAPAISVILPTYNRAELLPRAIASVLTQSFTDFELLIVDDGSTDDSAAVIAAHADPRIRVLQTAGRSGSAAARNLGIAAARGEWLAFQDSDDEWLAGKLEQQLAYARMLTPDYAVIGHRLLRHLPDGVESLAWPRLPSAGEGRGEVDRSAFLRGMSAYLQSLMIRRSACLEAGSFDARLRKSSDLELCLRLLKYRFAALDDVLAISYETSGSVSQNLEAAVASWRQILQRHAERIAHDPVASSNFWTELGRCELALGQRSAAATSLWRGLRARPSNRKCWFWLALIPMGKSAIEGRQRMRQTARALRRS